MILTHFHNPIPKEGDTIVITNVVVRANHPMRSVGEKLTVRSVNIENNNKITLRVYGSGFKSTKPISNTSYEWRIKNISSKQNDIESKRNEYFIERLDRIEGKLDRIIDFIDKIRS